MSDYDDILGTAQKNGETKADLYAIEYVVVGESEDGDKMELPTQPSDGTLGLATLTHAFPGAHGLKYRTPTTGASRALLLDSTGTCFIAPADGWANKVFVVIYPQRSAGDQNTKRKMMDECEVDSDSEDCAGGHGPGGQLTAKQKRFENPLEKNCTDLIVLGLPYKTSSDTIKAYFETFGEVVMFDLKTDQNGDSKGFGFVRMKDIEAQSRILAKQVHDIDGRRCQVKIPLSKGEAAVQSFNTRVFVGRVPERITGEELRAFFNVEAAKIDPESSVTDVFIPRPFRSFAFVNFTSAAVAREIIKLGDVIVSGSSLVLSAAAPRDAPDFSPRPQQKSVYGIGPQTGASFPRKPGSLPGAQRFESFTLDPAQSSYYASHTAGTQWDNSPGGAFRGAENRSVNRFNPGYAKSPRYVPNRAGGSQALTSGMDALNLDKMHLNPDMMNAAWQAFWTTLSSQQGGTPTAPTNPKM